MAYATLMVQLDLGHSNTGLLQIAGDLADRFKAHVIGVAACKPMQFVYGEGYVAGDIIEADWKQIDAEIGKAEAEFRNALKPHAESMEWCSIRLFSGLSDEIAREACKADLVITNVAPNSILDMPRRADISDLVMQAGRPVLIVPQAAKTLGLDRVVLAWKDTRETRRAAVDALPLLKKVARVTVVEIAAEEELTAARSHLVDVTLWLKRHGIAADAIASLSAGDDATQLRAILAEQKAGLVVAGAYGHSRMREWALGGVTHDLLLKTRQCSLLSH